MTKNSLVSKNTALKMAIEAMKITDKAFTEFSKGLVGLGIPASILKLDKQSRLIPAIQVCKEALAQPAQEPVISNEQYQDLLYEYCKLKADNERLREALEKLARLGNGELYGNSEGNLIAQQALSAAIETKLKELNP